MGDYNVEGEWNTFIFKKIQPEDHPKILELIVEHFLPCVECLGYNAETEAEDWIMIYQELLKDKHNLHFMALDKESGEIAGFRIIASMSKGESEEMPPFKHKTTIRIFQEFVDLSNQCHVEKYTDREVYANFFGICVMPKFRKMGLCTEMYKRAIAVSKAKGFTIAKVSFASPFSRKAAIKNGFKELGRKLCIDFKDENGVPLNPNVDPRWYLDMGIFTL